MRFVLTRDPHEFAEHTRGFIEPRLDCNLLATVLTGVLDGFRGATAPVFGYGVGDDDAVGFAALRTPPRQLLTSEIAPELAGEFVARWLEADPDVPGVNGLPGSARAIAAAWAAQTGGTTRCWMREELHALSAVSDPAKPASGALRVPRGDERPQLVEWMRAFEREIGIGSGDLAAEVVDARLARDGLLVWDRGGPVSLLGVSPPVAGVVRIGPVYTPPEHRRHGYAGTAVAAVSRRALAAGARRCMLFADLANPTANKIYAEVGYRRIADWEEYSFSAPG
jgi:RimJ/RimL family protein N-acetyltransferase